MPHHKAMTKDITQLRRLGDNSVKPIISFVNVLTDFSTELQ